MSPPTPVFSRSEIQSRYKQQLKNPKDFNCSIKSLVQSECTFKLSQENSRVQETICVPFKRVFQRCLIPQIQRKNGQKVIVKRWINIEITLENTNNELKGKYSEELLQFMKADVELKKWMETMPED